MSRLDRKAAIRDYKERKVAAGIFAVRGGESVWVGASRNLGAAKNGLWFGLKLGTHHDRPLQQEWTARAGEGFEFEVLETLDEDIAEMAVKDTLAERKAAWAERLNAGTLL